MQIRLLQKQLQNTSKHWIETWEAITVEDGDIAKNDAFNRHGKECRRQLYLSNSKSSLYILYNTDVIHSLLLDPKN